MANSRFWATTWGNAICSSWSSSVSDIIGKFARTKGPIIELFSISCVWGPVSGNLFNSAFWVTLSRNFNCTPPKTCACQSQPPPVVVTCVQLLVVTYKSWQPKLLLSNPAVSLRVPPDSGTAYLCHSAIRHWHLDNSAAGWKLICLV